MTDILEATRVASISINSTDTLWVVKHYTGAGFTDCYILRKNEFLGRFQIQDQFTIDAVWYPKQIVMDKELQAFRKARMSLMACCAKLWNE